MLVRSLNSTDKAVVTAALRTVGVHARIRMQRIGFRVCFEGSWETVAGALNELGYLTAAGGRFERHSFNGAGEVFVRYAT